MRSSALAFALAASCAAVGETAPPGPSAFQGVRSVALVRWVDDPGARRPKDALDALRESLEARGYETRLVEIGPRSPGRHEVERLFGRVDARIASGAGRDRTGRGVDRAEGDVAAAVASLGVDAVAMVHRLQGQVLPMPFETSPFGPALPGSVFDQPRTIQQYRPVGALSLASRSGLVVWFDWGSSEPAYSGSATENAAEAVDAILSTLSGQTDDG